ncbi:uncharacterized protein LOC128418307 isoform X2 [Podarcis raffonei]|uniref:uncharacterized protein LOC128418307 isoform X2 n=1 Tax=Podarcis raffonei TaxID=65483 RepID=UPI0023293F4C|nr:uncharacterized protein LOC128418307 isoform X2 [Podarcis raffonei]
MGVWAQLGIPITGIKEHGGGTQAPTWAQKEPPRMPQTLPPARATRTTCRRRPTVCGPSGFARSCLVLLLAAYILSSCFLFAPVMTAATTTTVAVAPPATTAGAPAATAGAPPTTAAAPPATTGAPPAVTSKATLPPPPPPPPPAVTPKATVPPPPPPPPPPPLPPAATTKVPTVPPGSQTTGATVTGSGTMQTMQTEGPDIPEGPDEPESPGDEITIDLEPVTPEIGMDVTLIPKGIGSYASCTWFRGSKEKSKQILTYIPPPNSSLEYHFAYTGRESVNAECALHITKLTPQDATLYLLQVEVQGVGGKEMKEGEKSVVFKEAKPPEEDEDEGAKAKGLPLGIIAAIAIGSLFGIILAGGLITYQVKRSKAVPPVAEAPPPVPTQSQPPNNEGQKALEKKGGEKKKGPKKGAPKAQK